MDWEQDDLKLLGTEREAVFRQASLFDYKETGIDSYAIPDEADQMGVPDTVRFEQRQKINNYHVAYEDSEGK